MQQLYDPEDPDPGLRREEFARLLHLHVLLSASVPTTVHGVLGMSRSMPV